MSVAEDMTTSIGSRDGSRAFQSAGIAILTISDTRDQGSDKSGALLSERVVMEGHRLVHRAFVKDEKAQIQRQVQAWIDDLEVHVIVSTGGTGLTGRDVTTEAMRELFEKEMDGFQFLFHLISDESIGVCTLQSRACAGIARGTVIFALPGSSGACKDAWDKIIRPELDSQHRPCSLIQLMPRFTER